MNDTNSSINFIDFIFLSTFWWVKGKKGGKSQDKSALFYLAFQLVKEKSILKLPQVMSKWLLFWIFKGFFFHLSGFPVTTFLKPIIMDLGQSKNTVGKRKKIRECSDRQKCQVSLWNAPLPNIGRNWSSFKNIFPFPPSIELPLSYYLCPREKKSLARIK